MINIGIQSGLGLIDIGIQLRLGLIDIGIRGERVRVKVKDGTA